MKLDALPSTGLIPNGPRVRQELVKAISFCEVLSDAHFAAAPQVFPAAISDAGWVTGVNVTKVGEQVRLAAAPDGGEALRIPESAWASYPLVVGETFDVAVVVSGYVAGGVRVYSANGGASAALSGNGVLRVTIAAGPGAGTAGSVFAVQSTGGATTLNVESVSVKRAALRTVEQAKTLDTFLSSAKTALVPLLDTTAPAHAAATLQPGAGRTKILWHFTELLDQSVLPAAAVFTTGPANSVTAVAYVDANTLRLTLDHAYGAGDTSITATYTQPAVNGLRDSSGNLVANTGAIAVTNVA